MENVAIDIAWFCTNITVLSESRSRHHIQSASTHDIKHTVDLDIASFYDSVRFGLKLLSTWQDFASVKG